MLSTRLTIMDTYSRKPNLVICGLKPESYSDALSGPGITETVPTQTDSLLPTHSTAATLKGVLKLFNETMKLGITENDISAAHRLPSKAVGSKKTGGGSTVAGESATPGPSTMGSGPPDIIVRFNSIRVRDSVYYARKTLQGKKIYINEHLTPECRNIFAKARALRKSNKISSAWTYNGTVFVKVSNNVSERPKKIVSDNDLDKFE